MPTQGELAHQNIKDRYNGQNDPVAKKMMGKTRASSEKLVPPQDQAVTTLWIGGIDAKVTEQDIRFVCLSISLPCFVSLFPPSIS
jgi:pre-mRNA-splicing factor RBM22/SLT11